MCLLLRSLFLSLFISGCASYLIISSTNTLILYSIVFSFFFFCYPFWGGDGDDRDHGGGDSVALNQWRAVAGGVPDIPINDCARMFTGLGGSGAYEQSRQAGISEEIGSFVKEMKPFPSMDGIDKKGVDATLTITSNDSKRNTWIGFKVDGSMYLRGNGWDDMDIREVKSSLSRFFLMKPSPAPPLLYLFGMRKLC